MHGTGGLSAIGLGHGDALRRITFRSVRCRPSIPSLYAKDALVSAHHLYGVARSLGRSGGRAPSLELLAQMGGDHLASSREWGRCIAPSSASLLCLLFTISSPQMMVEAVAAMRGHLSRPLWLLVPLCPFPSVSPSSVGDDRSVVLEVHHRSVSAAERPSLSDDDGVNDLPPHLWGTLLHDGDDDVPHRCAGVAAG